MSQDKKDAVGIGVNLSGQLISACLTMIAVLGAFVTFSFDKKEFGPGYILIVGGAFGAFITSIFLGGRGIDKARKTGFEEEWSIDTTRSDFNLQALFAFIGIFAFVVSVFIGSDKPEKRDEDLKVAFNKILTLEDSLRSYSKILESENIKIRGLQAQIDGIQDTLYHRFNANLGRSKESIPSLPKR